MSKINEGDTITVSCSGVVQHYRVLDPETLTCEMFFYDSPFGRDGERAGDRLFTFEHDKLGVDETRTALIKHWGSYMPTEDEVKEAQRKEMIQCQSET